MSRIDFGFISKLEGGQLRTGYVPDADSSQSGVTIATGFDLGARNVNDLQNLGLPQALIEKLSRYLGKQGTQAEFLLLRYPLTISKPEADAIDKAVAFVEERLNGVDGLGAIYPAMENSVKMYAVLGYPADHPSRAIARKSLDKLLVIKDDEAYCQPCVSPVWDTALVAHALLESGSEKAVALSAADTIAMAAHAEFDEPLLDYAKKGMTVKLIGMADVKGTQTYDLEVTTKSGDVEHHFLDASTFLLAKRTFKGKDKDGKVTEMSVRFGDYKRVQGRMVNHSVEWDGPDGKASTSAVSKVKFDGKLDAKLFAMPK